MNKIIRSFACLMLCIAMLLSAGCSPAASANPEEPAEPPVAAKPLFADDDLAKASFPKAFAKCDFVRCAEILSDYLADHPDSEPEQEALAITEELIFLSENATVEYDDFDEEYTLKYIAKENGLSLGSFYYPSTGTCYTAISINNDDWIFMEHIDIKFGSDNYLKFDLEYFDVQRDVSGSHCTESVAFPMNTEEVDKFMSSKNTTWRISGDGGSVDYNISGITMWNIGALHKLAPLHKELEKMLSA